MGAVLAELGRRVADRWITLLVLPGLLFTATAFVADTLGQVRWRRTDLLAIRLDHLIGQRPATDTSNVIVLVAGVLLTAVASGLAAQFLGAGIERLWVAQTWPWPLHLLARTLVGHRERRWTSAHDHYRAALLQRARQHELARHGVPQSLNEPDSAPLLNKRNKIGLTAPRSPTWIGDRLLAADTRIHQTYRLDLPAAWPALQLLMPEQARAQVNVANSAFRSAATLMAWGLLYFTLGTLWWPALIGGGAIAAVAAHRGRVTSDVYARLVEAVVDLHARDLAITLGINCPGRFDPGLGDDITRLLRKDAAAG